MAAVLVAAKSSTRIETDCMTHARIVSKIGKHWSKLS